MTGRTDAIDSRICGEPIFEPPPYWNLPFDEGVRVLIEIYGESEEQARLVMAMHCGLLPGDAVPVDERGAWAHRDRGRAKPARPDR